MPKREIRIAVTIARADAGYFHESKRSYTEAPLLREQQFASFASDQRVYTYVRAYVRSAVFIFHRKLPTRRDATRDAARHDATRRGARLYRI